MRRPYVGTDVASLHTRGRQNKSPPRTGHGRYIFYAAPGTRGVLVPESNLFGVYEVIDE